MILLVWTKQRNIKHDYYEAIESLSEAKERYDELIKFDDTYSASICSIIESTDYDFKEVKE